MWVQGSEIVKIALNRSEGKKILGFSVLGLNKNKIKQELPNGL